jgi:hypothetical protein
MQIPCLIIAYLRLDGIKRLCESLPVEKIDSIYVAIDGPRTQSEKEIQTEIRNFVLNYAKSNKLRICVWQRDVNLGIAVSVITAIDWFFNNVEYGIILEDDLLVSKEFFDFVDYNLILIKEIPDIAMISGNQFLLDTNPDFTYLTHYPQTWGWATWNKKWNLLKRGLLEEVELSRFNFANSVVNFWNIGTKRVHDGLTDTWDIPLARYMKFNSKKCILPSSNLVTNLGFDSFSSNTKKLTFPLGVELSSTFDHHLKINSKSLAKAIIIDDFLEKKVFIIKPRHRWLPLYSFLFDRIRFNSKQNVNLKARLKLVKIPFL